MVQEFYTWRIKKLKRYHNGDFIILLLYIDMLITRHEKSKIDWLKEELRVYFTMKDLGPTKI